MRREREYVEMNIQGDREIQYMDGVYIVGVSEGVERECFERSVNRWFV